jgi:hypothetical protein
VANQHSRSHYTNPIWRTTEATPAALDNPLQTITAFNYSNLPDMCRGIRPACSGGPCQERILRIAALPKAQMGVLAVFPLYYQRTGIVRSSLAVGFDRVAQRLRQRVAHKVRLSRRGTGGLWYFLAFPCAWAHDDTFFAAVFAAPAE